MNTNLKRPSWCVSGFEWEAARAIAGRFSARLGRPDQRRAKAMVETLEKRTLLSGLTIVPTYAANIQSDPNAAEIETAIQAGITQIESNLATPITVPIEFQETSSGLGESLTYYNVVSYSTWLGAMQAQADGPSGDANQLSAVASLPATNTVNGSNNVDITLANELALGLPASSEPEFGTISLNTSDCNLNRSSINSDDYDLQGVAMHEMDEVLGIGSSLNEVKKNGNPIPTDDIRPEDFFRYSAGPGGTPDYTTSASAAVYFSIDGGNSDLAQFNQTAGADFNDWYSINGTQVPQVQDAFGTPGAIANYNVEPVVLDTLGYTAARTLGTGIVTGNVFNDANGNGTQDQGESNLSGWTIEALQNGNVVTSALSNSLNYQLGSLADGTYTIEAVPQNGFTQTTPASYTVTISGHNQTTTGENFGEETAAATTTALTKNTTTAISFGQSVTFTATTTAVNGNVGTPTGTVSFMNGNTVLGTAALSGGVATFTTSSLAPGIYSVTAEYTGSGTFNTSTSNPLKQTVNQSATTTKLTKNTTAPIVFGQSVTFTATLAPVSPGAGTPSGTVSFMNGSTVLGTATVSGGVATFTTTSLTAGADSVTAVYSGDTDFTTSTSSGVKQTVNQSATTTKLTKNTTAPIVFGQSVTFTATLAPVSPGAGTPTGAVSFMNGSTVLGTATLSGGVAMLTDSSLAPGVYSVTAVYSGDTDFTTSTSSAARQTVNQSATTTKLTKNTTAPIVFGQSVTLTATLAPVSPGAGTPTGTVTFEDNGASIGTGTLSDGLATLTTTTLPAGTNSLTAVYGGDPDFTTSTSGSVTQTVNG